ncbi:MAG: hypothetical protein NZM43_04010 [Saprospiraceae bacterium]|nr:hypothetical protein [Saprospiraceae bacterium]MDW8483471.1 hypothetical protein [Saprospiraceae bacterium]
MKHALVLCSILGFVNGVKAQPEVKLPYKPAHSDPAPAPVVHNAPSSMLSSSTRLASGAPTTAMPSEDAMARRAAAIAKVKAKQIPAKEPASSQMSARSVAPVTYSTSTVAPLKPDLDPDPTTTVTVNGLNVQRNVRPGRGQVGTELFTPVSELHFVQFAVYCKDTPVDKAPPIEGLYLLWHPGSTCPGGAKGASYIVKGYNSAEEAKAAVATFKAKGIECWYNPALTGAEVEIIGVR